MTQIIVIMRRVGTGVGRTSLYQGDRYSDAVRTGTGVGRKSLYQGDREATGGGEEIVVSRFADSDYRCIRADRTV